MRSIDNCMTLAATLNRHHIGTITADDAVPDTITGSDADYAWVGGHRKLYEHQGSIAAIEMGARVYVPALGRFMSVDPIEGGVTNAYDYPADPINKVDLTGTIGVLVILGIVAVIALVLLMPSSVAGPPPAQPTRKSAKERIAPQSTSGPSNPTAPKVPSKPRGKTASPQPGSFDGNARGCYVGCLELGGLYKNNEILGSIGLGVGAEVGLSAGAGYGHNKSPGLSVGAQCTAALGPIGVYAGAGFGLTDGALRWSPSGYGEIGYAPGAQLGCSANVAWTWSIAKW